MRQFRLSKDSYLRDPAVQFALTGWIGLGIGFGLVRLIELIFP